MVGEPILMMVLAADAGAAAAIASDGRQRFAHP